MCVATAASTGRGGTAHHGHHPHPVAALRAALPAVWLAAALGAALLLLVLAGAAGPRPILLAHLVRLPGYLVSVLLALASAADVCRAGLPAVADAVAKGMSASDSGGSW